MPPHGLLPGLAFLVAAAALVGAQLSDPSPASAASLGSSARVTLYEPGLADVSLDVPFTATGGNDTVSLDLPAGALVNSLLASGTGVTVLATETGPAATSGIQRGDNVAIHVGSDVFRGTAVSTDRGTVVLATNNGTTVVDTSHASAWEILPGAGPRLDPGTIPATFHVLAEPGPRVLTVSYLFQGSGWTPTYRLDADSGRLAFSGSFTAPLSWANVSLDLVSGKPQAPSQPLPLVMYAQASPAAPSPPAEALGPSTALGDLHRYHIPHPIRLASGATAQLLVAEGDVPAMDGYEASVDASGPTRDVPVTERLTFRNTLTEPLPSGQLLAYRDGAWIGADTLAATPPGAFANVTLGPSTEVHANLTLVSHVADAQRDTSTYALRVRNDLSGAVAKAAPVHVVLRAPQDRTTITSWDPTSGATLTGATLTWDVTLGRGQSRTFEVTYTTQAPTTQMVEPQTPM